MSWLTNFHKTILNCCSIKFETNLDGTITQRLWSSNKYWRELSFETAWSLGRQATAQALKIPFLWQMGSWIFSQNRRKTCTELPIIFDDSPDTINLESLLIHIDQEHSNVLRDNIFYYIAGYVIRHLPPQLDCKKCHHELLMNVDDPNGRKSHIQLYTKLTHQKQKGGLLFPSSAVLNIVRELKLYSGNRLLKWRKALSLTKQLTWRLSSHCSAGNKCIQGLCCTLWPST